MSVSEIDVRRIVQRELALDLLATQMAVVPNALWREDWAETAIERWKERRRLAHEVLSASGLTIPAGLYPVE